MTVLSAVEQSSFDLVIAAGRDSGWLSVASVVTVEANQAEVSVRVVTDGVQQLFLYERNEQWLYRFLRDLVEQRA